jgi:hypothetical protein
MYMEQMTQALSIAAPGLAPISLAAATPTGTGGVDMSKFGRALFVLSVGVFGASATVDMKLQESSDNATWTDMAVDIPTISNVAITTLLAAGGNNREASLEVRADQLLAGKKFVRALITVGTAATLVQCTALGGEAVNKPGSARDDASVAQRLVAAGPT